MSRATSIATKDFCLRLLRSESEDEVVGILRESGYWDDRSVWRPYGDISNNRSIVGNQQSSPVASLVEKLVNSIDAVLTAECYRRGIDPKGPKAPENMSQAVEQFFGVRGGRIQNIDRSARKQLEAHIQLVVCGSKSNPCFMIIDDGEGQNPEDFPKTFLSLLGENKTHIPFVQGKHNMGGTGVLQFAGRHSFQLIISKRQPDLKASSVKASPKWGFTLIRRLEPGPGQPQSMYVYLAPGGAIPSFDSDSLQVRPGRYPDPYGADLSAGTCIKIWNYKIPGRIRSIATLDLRYELERYLQDPAIPLRIYERRQGYNANYYDTVMPGLSAVLADNRDYIEPGLDTGTSLDIPDVGKVDIRLVVIKEGVDPKRYPSGVFFNVNGQLHGEHSSDFISRRTKLDYIAKSIIVAIDCSSLPSRVIEDLFLTSRDRMRQIQERTALENEIVEYLQDHPGLRALNHQRRQARLKNTSEEETTKVFQDLVRTDPTLASLFGKGRKIRVPQGSMPEQEPYVGKQFPTFFRIHKEPKGGLVKPCPRNRSCRVEFETDANNDYFSRAKDPGHLTSRGVPKLISHHLWNGKALLRYALPENSNVGDQFRVEIAVTDISRLEPLVSCFTVKVEEDAPPPPSAPPPPPPGIALIGLPYIEEVHRDEWSKFGFNEHSGLQLKYGDEDRLDIFINMDNIHLANEIVRRRDTDPAIVRYWFKYGLCLLALGMIYKGRQSAPEQPLSTTEDGDERSNLLEIVAEACSGLAVTVIPVIAQLSRGAIHAQV